MFQGYKTNLFELRIIKYQYPLEIILSIEADIVLSIELINIY